MKKMSLFLAAALIFALVPASAAEMTEHVVQNPDGIYGNPIAAYEAPAQDGAAQQAPEQPQVVLDSDGTVLENADPERYFVQVDLTNQVVSVFERGDTGEYSVLVRQMICSTGKAKTPSPHGTFKMGAGRVRFGYFTKFNCYAQYWSQLTRNIYFHSVLYTKRDTKTLIKSSFNNLGKAASHGCIRLMPEDAKWLYTNICEGTKVTLTKSIKKNKELTKSLKPTEPPV